MSAEDLKFYVSRALLNVGRAGCSAARLAEALWPEQYPKGDDDGARMKKSSMVIKVRRGCWHICALPKPRCCKSVAPFDLSSRFRHPVILKLDMLCCTIGACIPAKQ